MLKFRLLSAGLSLPLAVIAIRAYGQATTPSNSTVAPPSPASTPARIAVGEQPDGSVLVSTGQAITPVGKVQQLKGTRPKDLALSPDGKTLAVLTQSQVAFFTPDGTPQGSVALRVGPLGIAWAPDSQTLFVAGDNGQIHRLAATGNTTGDAWKLAGQIVIAQPERAVSDATALEVTGKPELGKGNPQVAGLAVAPDGKRLYVALGITNAVAVVDLSTSKTIALVRVGVAPYRILLSRDGKILYVANRGGQPARDGETSQLSAGTAVRINPANDAPLRGSVTCVDTERLTATEIPAGRQPSGLALTPDGRTLYVANSDDDTVSVINTQTKRLVQALTVRPAQDPYFGQIPTDLKVSGNGNFLYVACGGANAVAVVHLRQTNSRLNSISYLPTGWYPIALAERDGQLFVANSKGIGSRNPNAAGAFRVHGSVGTVQFISPEARRDTNRYTRQVALNNRWGTTELPARPGVAPVPIPERVGEPSVFKHVVYIIKENHTYDTDFGDMPEGNGDKSLCIFGEEVTPNQHALARQFVLLDNTYTSGTNSADGHQWVSASIANGYVEQNYAANARSYPFDGGDALSNAPEGFLWNLAARHGKSLRVYGEYVDLPQIKDPQTGRRPSWTELWQDYKAGTNKYSITADTSTASLKPYLHPNYIGFPEIVSDQWRADQFLKEFKQFEANNNFPNLSILLLPNNHTSGTSPGMPTPRASVADNDLAFGRIVEAITRSRFWPETLILVIEDDSQLGLDHVDGHRTIAFCISPYTRRGAVVSQPYNHTSMIRTMELALGLPAMNRFDRTATPMTACFTMKADLTPYTHRPARIPLDELNPPVRALRGEARRLAEASAKLDWSDVDRADAAVVARAAWHSQRPGEPFPWHKFKPNKDDDD